MYSLTYTKTYKNHFKEILLSFCFDELTRMYGHQAKNHLSLMSFIDSCPLLLVSSNYGPHFPYKVASDTVSDLGAL